MPWPETWTVQVGDKSCRCPLVTVSDDLSIYAFDLMGKCKLGVAVGDELAAELYLRADDFDCIITCEAKAIALADHVARYLGMSRYVVLRKKPKAYMPDPIKVDYESATTAGVQTFYLGRDDAAFLEGKRVVIVDDLVSTGGTLDAILKICGLVGCEVAAIACVLTEGEERTAYRGFPLFSLDHLPLPVGPYPDD